MPHETPLLATVAAAFGLAFVFGYLAARIRLQPLVGYLLAGIVVGPFTPGYVADVPIAAELAEIGVILLMFGVGLHFSPRDLLAVKRIAIPGALVQIAAASLMTAFAEHLYGWTLSAGLVFGFSLSVASTVVLLRALEQRGIVQSEDGRIAIGWLIVEDLVTVFILVLLPALAPAAGEGAVAATRGPIVAVFLALVKAAVFLGLMLFAGRRAIPKLLSSVANMGSRELFTLAVVALALGIAVGAAMLFGVSFALGAFFAGVIIGESDVSHRAAADALPLQDAFAVLFFVSVGMLFNPRILVDRPVEVLIAVLIIIVGKSLAAFGIVRALRYPMRTALVVSAGLSQIGELSFILIALAVSLKLVPAEGRDLVLAGALVSITLNPLIFGLAERLLQRATSERSSVGQTGTIGK